MIAAIRSFSLWPLLLIGLINGPMRYWTAYWDLDWRIGLAALTTLAFAAGWFTPEKLWGAVLALLMPVMFLGTSYHGRPWQLLIGSFIHPVALLIFLVNVGPIIVAYTLVVLAGYWARRHMPRGQSIPVPTKATLGITAKGETVRSR